MKKKIIIITSVIIILILVICGAYMIDKNRMANNKPVIFSTWGYSYVPPINLPEKEIKSAILDYMVERGDNEKHYPNEKTFASMRVYLIEEKESFKLFNIYAWVLEEKYYLENNEIKQEGGSSIPYKFVIENIDGKYVVTDSRMPRDGSYYVDDMKNIFPSSVRNDMNEIQTDGTIDELITDIQEQKEVYFGETLYKKILDEELVLLSDDGMEFKLSEDMVTIDKEATYEHEGRGDGFHWKEYTYEDIFVKALIADDNSTNIILISTASNKYKTSRDIKVGDSLQKLKEKYPEDLTKANSDKVCYVYEPQGVGFKRIYFYIENDIIVKINLEDSIDG